MSDELKAMFADVLEHLHDESLRPRNRLQGVAARIGNYINRTTARRATEGANMTDRELLSLAAKAAGRIVGEGVDPIGRKHCEALGIWCDGPWAGWFNPLTDDSDALRLAVTRKVFRCHMDLFHKFYEESIDAGFSEIEATRRAIVRAAATALTNLGVDAK
jgi:hypothetical protein